MKPEAPPRPGRRLRPAAEARRSPGGRRETWCGFPIVSATPDGVPPAPPVEVPELEPLRRRFRRWARVEPVLWWLAAAGWAATIWASPIRMSDQPAGPLAVVSVVTLAVADVMPLLVAGALATTAARRRAQSRLLAMALDRHAPILPQDRPSPLGPLARTLLPVGAFAVAALSVPVGGRTVTVGDAVVQVVACAAVILLLGARRLARWRAEPWSHLLDAENRLRAHLRQRLQTAPPAPRPPAPPAITIRPSLRHLGRAARAGIVAVLTAPGVLFVAAVSLLRLWSGSDVIGFALLATAAVGVYTIIGAAILGARLRVADGELVIRGLLGSRRVPLDAIGGVVEIGAAMYDPEDDWEASSIVAVVDGTGRMLARIGPTAVVLWNMEEVTELLRSLGRPHIDLRQAVLPLWELRWVLPDRSRWSRGRALIGLGRLMGACAVLFAALGFWAESMR